MKKLTMTLFAVLIIFAMIFSGCSNTDQSTNDSEAIASQQQTNTDADALVTETNADDDLGEIEVEYSDKDKDASYDEQTSTKIALADDSTSIVGSGASVSGNIVTITSAGTYVISGVLTNGQLVVDSTKVDTVQIVFDGVDITNKTGSAIYVKQAEKAIITIADGSSNSISDSANYAAISEDDPDAAIYAGDDLTINGTGSLTVNGNYKHAIKTVDDLVVTGGNLVINSVEEGLRGKDSVSVLDGSITIDAGGDGIKSNNSEDGDSGWVSIDGGTLTIKAANNGIGAQKGLLITAGELNISSTQDTLHCNGSIRVSGGNITLDAGDDGIHADNSLDVIDGYINVLNSYEGLEGSDISISGGQIFVEADDDGLNAAGGSDNDMMPGDKFSSTGSYFIAISGGYTYVNSNSDGVDSNGDIAISGGTLVVHSAETGDGAPIDIDNGNYVVSGGIMIMAGSSQMLASPTQATQPVVTILYDTMQSGGQAVTLTNTNDDVLFSIKPAKTYQCLTITSPDLVPGETYNVLYNGEVNGESVDNTLYTNASVSAETDSVNFTVSDSVLYIDPQGEITQYAGNGGHGGGGGHHGGGPDGTKPQDDKNVQTICNPQIITKEN